MGLSDGDAFVSGDIFSYQQGNRIKDAWRGATAPTNPQPGSLFSDSDDDKLYHYQAAAYKEIFQAEEQINIVNAVAGGTYGIRLNVYQDDAVALTGTLRGAYFEASNGDLAATGVIRGAEFKARTARPGETGNNVAILEGISVSSDAKTYEVTTVQRGAEFILDGGVGASIVKGVGVRIAQNYQADIATLCYGLEFYWDSFEWDADIILASGGTIGGKAGDVRIPNTGQIEINKAAISGEIGVDFYSAGGYFSTIAGSDAEGLAGGDLRIGLDESNHTFIICDRGDINTDFGLTAKTDPILLIANAAGSFKVSLNTNGDSWFMGGDFGIGMTAPGVKLDILGTHIGGIGLVRFKGDAGSGFMTLDTTTGAAGDEAGFLVNLGGVVHGQFGAKGDDTVYIKNRVFGTAAVIGISSSGYVGIRTTAPDQLFELEEVETITGAAADGYAAGLRLDPGYTAATAQTVTRHNYIDVQDVSVAGAGPAAVTNAAVFRFNAAIATHKAVLAGFNTTDSGADTTAWAAGIIININGTLYKIPVIAV